ncbi:MAG: GNAT family N-acetyltransferase [Bacillota bacterium]|nr:GNAT family N-acetyltransferase [Bacillota bacterium]
MDHMVFVENIIQCELNYTRQFCVEYEDENIIRFRNHEIRDMHSHNFTYIKKKEKELKIRSLIEEEIAVCKNERVQYCNLIINSDVHSRILSYIQHPSVLSINGFYKFDFSKLQSIKSIEGCRIEKVTTVEALDDILTVDLDADEAINGRDFCVRRCYGRSPIYLKDNSVEAYLCYHGDDLIGRCDLFISGEVAKIEDFSIIGKYQRLGYGSTMLRSMIEKAIDRNCETVYLVTNELDSAKYMYEKNGFDKIGQMSEIRFIL